MTVGAAWRDGVRRVNAAPFVLAGMFAVTLLIALPLAIALRGMIEAHLGDSLTAAAVADGNDLDWWREFSSQASGLGTTFVPSIVGFSAVLDNLAGLLDNLPMAATVAGATAAWMIVWSFLSGGVLDRYARQRPTRSHGFFAACGTHFWRFLRLGVLAWLCYGLLYWLIHPWLFDNLYPWLTRDLTVERTAFLIRLVLYLVFGVMLIACNLVFDYARIRTVVEDRHSAIGSLVAGARFVGRHPQAVRLYLLNGLVFLLLVVAYALLSPGAPGGFAIWVALAIGQLYILLRHYVKLLFYASQIAYFQGALAHASYAAGPQVEWPDSPSAELISNTKPQI
jgi:hypothetical protein